MFYESTVISHVRVPPNLFGENTQEAVLKELNRRFDRFISPDLGVAIAVSDVLSIGDGVIVPGDGAAFYETTFKVLTYKPEMQEVLLGRITDITDFGAFIEIGPIDGMIHISQTMDDFVSFSKANILTGKDSKRVLKVKDLCRARIIAVSFKEPTNPKIGLTMRQPRLGNLTWIEEDMKRETQPVKGKKK